MQCEYCEEYKPEWIEVKQRLPNENQEEVIVSLEQEDGDKLVTVLIYEDGEFGHEYYQDIPQSWVKAWMPLPEPFKSK